MEKITRKTYGVVVGSRVGLCYFEGKWVITGNARPSILFRYVHDSFTMFDSKDTALICL